VVPSQIYPVTSFWTGLGSVESKQRRRHMANYFRLGFNFHYWYRTTVLQRLYSANPIRDKRGSTWGREYVVSKMKALLKIDIMCILIQKETTFCA
jgi:hypothetical protein